MKASPCAEKSTEPTTLAYVPTIVTAYYSNMTVNRVDQSSRLKEVAS